MNERQPVRLKKGQQVLIDAGRGAQIEVRKYPSGEVELRNATSGALLRTWSPKEAKG